MYSVTFTNDHSKYSNNPLLNTHIVSWHTSQEKKNYCTVQYLAKVLAES